MSAFRVALALAIGGALGTVALFAGSTPGRAQSAPSPQAAYESKCGGCHSVDSNRVGPLHRGVIGRTPGAVPGYAYSAAIKRLGGVWTPARLDQWLQNPQRLAPGSKMYLSVSDPAQRKVIISYLQSVSPPAPRRK
jgi:cytochrome c